MQTQLNDPNAFNLALLQCFTDFLDLGEPSAVYNLKQNGVELVDFGFIRGGELALYKS